MNRVSLILTLVMSFTLSTVAFAERAFKVYPGAKLEEVDESNPGEAANKMQKVPKVIIYTTNDFFENVVAFYRGTGREYRMPGTGERPLRLSTGQELKEAYFIFDNAPDIMTSKHWIKIQRPYLSRGRTGEDFRVKFKTTRDVTAIIEEDKRTYP